jgi:hypothetical protein
MSAKEIREWVDDDLSVGKAGSTMENQGVELTSRSELENPDGDQIIWIRHKKALSGRAEC